MLPQNFIPGLQLSEQFFHNEVHPLMQKYYPELSLDAGLLGHGSEVLGFDTTLSADHDWGPRVILFLAEQDMAKSSEISQTLAEQLPKSFLGYSVAPENSSAVRKDETDQISTKHRVEVTTVRKFFEKELGIDSAADINTTDWLTLPQQRLLSVTAGQIFANGLGELENARTKFAYYPHDVWLFMMASQWQKISQLDSFMGRTGDVGDEIGSQIISARLCKYAMELCFMLERKYMPYAKWFGTAFSRLELSKELSPLIERVLQGTSWKIREETLSGIYEALAVRHNLLKITNPIATKVTSFFDWPYVVIHADTIAKTIAEKIDDQTLKHLQLIGAVDQFLDSTDILESTPILTGCRSIFDAAQNRIT